MSIAGKAMKITTNTLQEMKRAGEKITMLTAYDYSMARILDGAGIDVILVGDSASNVMAGNDTTVPITLDQMIYHAQCVVNGVDRALIVCDMPFGSYQGDSKQALNSAIRIMKESGAHAVKLEGGAEIVESIERILTAEFRSWGTWDLLLNPSTSSALTPYGRERKKRRRNSLKMQSYWKRPVVFPLSLRKSLGSAAKVTAAVNIPTIGIGAGSDVDGQVLVVHDLIGLTHEFNPRFLRRYLNLYDSMTKAVKDYIEDVRTQDFPNADERYS